MRVVVRGKGAKTKGQLTVGWLRQAFMPEFQQQQEFVKATGDKVGGSGSAG